MKEIISTLTQKIENERNTQTRDREREKEIHKREKESDIIFSAYSIFSVLFVVS